jgi:hypothetical protein
MRNKYRVGDTVVVGGCLNKGNTWYGQIVVIDKAERDGHYHIVSKKLSDSGYINEQYLEDLVEHYEVDL